MDIAPGYNQTGKGIIFSLTPYNLVGNIEEFGSRRPEGRVLKA